VLISIIVKLYFRTASNDKATVNKCSYLKIFEDLTLC